LRTIIILKLVLLWHALSNFTGVELQGKQRRPAVRVAGVVTELGQSHKLLSAGEVDDLIARYEAGGTVKGLARELGVHHATARHYLNRAGVMRPRREPLSKLEVAEAVELYGTGLSIAQVAAKFDRKYQTMRQALLRAGVQMRPPLGR